MFCNDLDWRGQLHASICFSWLLAIASLYGCGMVDNFFVDLQIDRLCKVDGGVRVFEHDKPPQEFLRADGTIDLQAIARARPTQSYYLKREHKYIRNEHPQLIRVEEALIRASDQKVLGIGVSYIRPMDHSQLPPLTYKACPPEGTQLVRDVFQTPATIF